MPYDLARSHPLRAALSAEMHVRRLPRFASPCRLMQVVTLLDEGLRADRDFVTDIGGQHGVTIAETARYAVVPLGDVTLVWEGHTEFATYTFIRQVAFDDPFDPVILGDTVARIAATLPGNVIRATQIAVAPRETGARGSDYFRADGGDRAVGQCHRSIWSKRDRSVQHHGCTYPRSLVRD